MTTCFLLCLIAEPWHGKMETEIESQEHRLNLLEKQIAIVQRQNSDCLGRKPIEDVTGVIFKRRRFYLPSSYIEVN